MDKQNRFDDRAREAAAETLVLPDENPFSGATQYRLHVRPQSGEPFVRSFSAPSVRVGSLAKNDLVLSDPAASRAHFELLTERRGVRLRDLGSTNGTLVDGVLAADVFLASGSRIEVGQTEIIYETISKPAIEAEDEPDRLGPLLGQSEVMRELFDTLKSVGPSEATVLIQGETGTGKELIAQVLHSLSPRRDGPLVVIDCASIPANLLESELFGHERGAFTGADSTYRGRFEQAQGGTLFLDELGELPLELQPKLLRALEQREVRRLGGREPISIDARFVGATNRNLTKEVAAGRFREDLYFRVAVVQLQVPPLRDRLDDLQPMVEHFYQQARGNSVARRLMMQASETSWNALRRHHWPGNVRELRNVVERSLVLQGADPLAESLTLGLPSVDAKTTMPIRVQPAQSAEEGVDLSRGLIEQRKERVAEFEAEFLKAALAESEGNISRAAQIAGIDRMYFKRLMKRYGITAK